MFTMILDRDTDQDPLFPVVPVLFPVLMKSVADPGFSKGGVNPRDANL